MKGINIQFEGIISFIDRTLQNKSVNQTMEIYLLNIEKITLQTLKIINIVFTNIDSKEIPSEVVRMYDKTFNKFKEYFKSKPKPQIQKQENIFPQEDQIQKYLDNRPQINQDSNLDERSQLYKFLSQTEEKQKLNKMMLENIPKFSYGPTRNQPEKHHKHNSDIKTTKAFFNQISSRTNSQIISKQHHIFGRERPSNNREIKKQYQDKEIQTDTTIEICRSFIQNYIKSTLEQGQNSNLQTEIYSKIFSQVADNNEILEKLLRRSKQRKSAVKSVKSKSSLQSQLQKTNQQQQQKQNKQVQISQATQQQTKNIQPKIQNVGSENIQIAKMVQNEKKISKGGKEIANRKNSIKNLNSKRDSTKRDSTKRDSIFSKKNSSLNLTEINGNRWKKKQTQRQSTQISQIVNNKLKSRNKDDSIEKTKSKDKVTSNIRNIEIVEENTYLQSAKLSSSKELTTQNKQQTKVQQIYNKKQINRNSQQSQTEYEKLSYKQHLSFSEDDNNPFQFPRTNQINWNGKNHNIQHHHNSSSILDQERKLPQISSLTKFSLNSQESLLKNKTFYQNVQSKRGREELQKLDLKNSKHNLANLHNSMHLTSPQFMNSFKQNNKSLYSRQKLINIGNLPSTINQQIYYDENIKGRISTLPLSKAKEKLIEQQDNRIMQQLTVITTKKGRNYEWTKIIKNIRDYESIHLNYCGQNCKHLLKFYQFLKNKNLSIYINRKILVLPKQNLEINTKFS